MSAQKRKLILILGWNLFITFSLILAIYLYGFFSENFGQDNKKLIRSNAARLIRKIKARNLLKNDLEAYIKEMSDKGSQIDIGEKFGHSFKRIDLTGINLSNANLRKTTLKAVLLNFGKLISIDMTDSTIIKAKFEGALLRSALLNRTYIKKTSFKSADLSDSSLINAIITSVNFTGANLSGANLSGAKLINVDLSNVNLNNALLDNAYLENVKIVNTDCFKIHLHNTIIKNSLLNGVKFNEGKIIDDSFISNDMDSVDFTGADLRGTKFVKNKTNKVKFP